MNDYVIFKDNLYMDDELHFRQGAKHDIIGEIDGKYAVSYMNKANPMECSLMPKDFAGFIVNGIDATQPKKTTYYIGCDVLANLTKLQHKLQVRRGNKPKYSMLVTEALNDLFDKYDLNVNPDNITF